MEEGALGRGAEVHVEAPDMGHEHSGGIKGKTKHTPGGVLCTWSLQTWAMAKSKEKPHRGYCHLIPHPPKSNAESPFKQLCQYWTSQRGLATFLVGGALGPGRVIRRLSTRDCVGGAYTPNSSTRNRIPGTKCTELA
eukprot:2194913-Rhodomonas_salina.1